MIRLVLRIALILSVAVGISACGSKFKRYNGPEVTRVVVTKLDRKMYLLHHDRVLKSFDVDLGFTPVGHKEFEGDGRTPEGRYFINRRNPESQFHLSLGISYPNRSDLERASSKGLRPGGDIFIHGGPRPNIDRDVPDWTAGCIAISNKEMEDVYAMVRDGTPVDIYGYPPGTEPEPTAPQSNLAIGIDEVAAAQAAQAVAAAAAAEAAATGTGAPVTLP